MRAKKRIGTVGKAIGCAVLLLISLFPIYWLAAMAIRPMEEMQGQISIIPHSLTVEHFVNLFVSKGFGQATVNSLQTTLSSLVLSLVVGICAAYIIARRRFRFGLKKPLTYWILLVRVLPPVAFTIPLYTMFSKLGLLNTKLPVTMACVLINVPLIIWFLISFFQDLPEEIEESAKVDGATEWQLFWRIAGGAGHRGGGHAVLHVRLERVHLHGHLHPLSRQQHGAPGPVRAEHGGQPDQLRPGGRGRRGVRDPHHPVCDLCAELLDLRTVERCCQRVTKYTKTTAEQPTRRKE